jgi:hypothetical protein
LKAYVIFIRPPVQDLPHLAAEWGLPGNRKAHGLSCIRVDSDNVATKR